MIYLSSAIVGILTGEILQRIVQMRIHSRMITTIQKSVSLMRRHRISDHWKERVLLKYSCGILLNTFYLTLLFAIVVAFVAASAWIAQLFEIDLLGFLVTPFGIIYITAVVAAYIYIKSRLVLPSENYSFISQCLHRFALGSRSIAEASFNMEQITQKPVVSPELINDRHVFVAGLARAGTTVLMRWIYSSGSFRSLTYRDMPFVLMPNLWQSISAFSHRKSVKQERAHGDGLLVDYDSPEALEDVFWRVFEGENYIQPDKLIPMTADEETIENFRTYVAAILKTSTAPEPSRYLSKNNNNILRLPSLRTAFPNAIIIIPFRDPLQHANSLLLQHRQFITKHASDPFGRKYMNWLAHHEFGSNHKRFCFSENPLSFTDPDTFNYWLELWIETYSWLSDNRPSGSFFLSYDLLCEDFEHVWPQAARKIGIQLEIPAADAVVMKKRTIDETIDDNLLLNAKQLHSNLTSQMKANL